MKRPKLLLVTPVSPFHPTNGSSIRIAAFLEAFLGEWEVTVLCLTRFGASKDAAAHVTSRVAELLVFDNPRSRRQARLRWLAGFYPYRFYLGDFRSCRGYSVIVEKMRMHNFDRVFCVETECLPVLKDCGFSPSICWMDIHNWYSQWWRSFIKSGSITRRVYGYISLLRQHVYERRYFHFVSNVVCVSDADRDSGARSFPAIRFHVVPNGVSPRFFDLASEARQHGTRSSNGLNVLFVGSLDVEMNIIGVRWLVKQIWPNVQVADPRAKLLIVGRNPDARLRCIKTANVEIVSNVLDVLPFYSKSSVVVNPVKLSGGSKLKVFEALASGLPIVSTSNGLCGIPKHLTKSIKVADDPLVFAQKIIESASLEQRSPPETLRDYSWDLLAKKLNDLMLIDV